MNYRAFGSPLSLAGNSGRIRTRKRRQDAEHIESPLAVFLRLFAVELKIVSYGFGDRLGDPPSRRDRVLRRELHVSTEDSKHHSQLVSFDHRRDGSPRVSLDPPHRVCDKDAGRVDLQTAAPLTL